MLYLLALLSLALAALNLWSAPPTPATTPVLLALAALGLEAAAVPLAGFGTFRVTFACLLAIALVPEGGPGTASLTLGLALLLTRRDLKEACSEGLPALAALAVARLHPAAGPLTYLALGWCLRQAFATALPRSELLVWLRLWRGVAPLWAVAAVAGVGVAQVVSLSYWHLVWILPLLWACLRAAEGTLVYDQARVAESARGQLSETRGKLDETVAQARELEGERDLLLRLSRALAGLTEPQAVAGHIVEAARRATPCRSVVLFLEREGRLVPFHHHSPEHEKLQAEELMMVGEPLVELCWQERRPLQSRPELRQPPRLFEPEQAAVALPIPGLGVLYVGRIRDDFDQDTLQILSLLCGQGASALESAQRFLAQQEALELHRQAHHQLQGWVTRLEQLMEGGRALSGSLEQRQLLQHFRHSLERLIPHHNGLVLERDHDHWATLCQWGTPFSTFDQLADSVLENGKPLLLPKVEETRFAQLAPQHPWLVAAPMDALEGVVLLSGADHEPTKEHRDLATMLAAQLSLALANARSFAALATAQSQLMQSAKLAAVGQLAAGVAHELNSPLATVRLALESFPADLPEASARRLARAQRALERANFIIERLLDYSRTSSRKPQDVSLDELVRETLEFLTPQLERDHFELDLRLEAGGLVQADPRELQQVLINLILNARDACADQRHIEVFTQRRDQQLCLGVRDCGQGISPADLERVFEPFFTTRKEGGTGLGLAISLEIAERWGGSLTLDSVEGEGTLALLSLPAHTP
ncbi:MAG: hypothetical protein KC910_15910 [Candidatus Eremiobacteraeota bacterium]|nr:hypothetical protein [Candidatus Eremiobacteraeota bacterium]